MLEHVVLAVLDLRRGRDGAEIQGGWLLRDHDFHGSRGAPYCRARPVGEQEDGLVHVPHGFRREHRLVLLDQGHDVRSRDVAMIDDDEPRPVDVLAEADARNAAARGGTPHRHAPQEVVEREIVHVPLVSRELRECFTTQHAGILSSCCAHGQGVTLRTLSMTLGVTVNGARYERAVEPRLLLSDFLRHELGLTGTHVGCEHGVCGACTVLLDGEAVRSCLMFAIQAAEHEITTVEGLAPSSGDTLHPLQAAFREAHGLQCGFCTPGVLMTLVPFLREHPNPDEREIREALAGNLCRCTGYQNIVAAVRLACGAPPSPRA